MGTVREDPAGAPAAALDDLLDLEAAADHLCVSKTTLYRMLDRSEVRGIKVGRQWRFRQVDLDAYLTRGPVAVALAAMPVEVLDREVAVFTEQLMQLCEPLPTVTDELLDQWEARVLRLLQCIVRLARCRQASDLYFEVVKEDNELLGLLRFRIDGVLHPVHRLPLRVYEALILRVRLMATSDVGNGSYLDASMHLPMGDGYEDIRLSIMPIFLGEAMTVRLLGDDVVQQPGLDWLGFHPDDLQRVREWLSAPSGLILVAGRTGSGKTTLMYKLLQEVAGPQRKVVTVEVMVERQLPWVTQVELNSKSRDTGSAMRAFMRHNVDMMMVGELRDLETLDLAVHGAETGHLTLAPVHVVSAVDPPKRMIEVFPLEQQPQIRGMLAKSLLGIIGLRLVRVLCPHCKQPATLPPDVLDRACAVARAGGYQTPAEAVFYRAVGCAECGHTGYQGRTGIFEVLDVDPAFRGAILHSAPREELYHLAIAHGMRTLAAEGVRKAAEGLTTLDEILPIVRQYEQVLG